MKAWFVHVFTREYFLLDIYVIGRVKRCYEILYLQPTMWEEMVTFWNIVS